MSDTIYRQDAIDALRTLEKPAPTAQHLSAIFDCEDVITSLPSAQPEDKCSERMPEEKDAGILKKLGIEKRSEYVLATIEDNGQRVTGTACTYDGKWDWDMKYAFPDYKVVAWMPLPEPWRGNE